MGRIALAALLVTLATPALAQQPVFCPTRPLGDNTNACASTAFVQQNAGGGGGSVLSVSNSNGTLTFSPNTGNVVGSLNLGNANTWTAAQTFSVAPTLSSITGSVQCLHVSVAGLISGTGADCGAGGGGAVSSVSNVDSSLTVSPTTGAVITSLNTANANTWTGAQTFNAGSSSSALTLSGVTGSVQCLHVNNVGLISGTGSDCGSGGGGGSLPNLKTTYGAVGNGTADDTPAFVAAYAAGGAFVVPCGTYNVTTTTITTSNTKLLGAGWGCAVIRSTTSNQPVILVNNNLSNIEISGVTIDRTTPAVAGGTGIDFHNSTDGSFIRSVMVQNQYNGIWLGPTGISTLQNFRSWKNYNNGVLLDDTWGVGGGTIQWWLDQGLLQQNDGNDIEIHAINDTVTLGTFTNLETYASTGACIYAHADTGMSIDSIRVLGGFFGSNNTHCIQIASRGGNHSFSAMHMELFGNTATGRTLSTTATHAGDCFNFDATNALVMITNAYCNQPWGNGITTSATLTQIIGGTFQNARGQAGIDSAVSGAKLFMTGVNSGNSGGGSLQQRGVLAADGNDITLNGGSFIGNALADIAATTNSRLVNVSYSKSVTLPNASIAFPTVAQGIQMYSELASGNLAQVLDTGTTGRYLRFRNTDGVAVFQAGNTNDPTMYFDHTTHQFTNLANSVNYLKINASGTTLQVLSADTSQVDATLCARTSDNLVMKGTGTAGICLGTSSERFKHDIAELGGGLDQIMRLKPITYKLNVEAGGDPRKTLYGFTAEQAATVLPDLVGHDDHGRPQTFDYMGVVPVLVRSVQQLQAEIKELRVERDEAKKARAASK